MGCLTTLPEFFHDCPRYGMGGVRAVWFALRAQVEGFYVDETYLVTEDSTDKYIRIPGHGSFQSVAQVDETTGLTYYRDELSFTPERMSPVYGTKLLAQLQAASPDDLIILVETWTDFGFGFGSGYVMGVAAADPEVSPIIDAPVFFSAGQLATGTAKGDFNGHTFGFTSVHPFPALSFYLNSATNPSTD